MGHKAIFFDRDDTLIKDKGYMYRIEDLEFFSDTIEVLQKLQGNGYLLFIVTNQSGIGRGYFSIKQMHEFNNHMIAELHKHGIKISDLAFCPHSPEDNCNCRKPSPEMINKLCLKHNISKEQSYMVGDKQSDIEAGRNAGVHSIQLTEKSLTNALADLL